MRHDPGAAMIGDWAQFDGSRIVRASVTIPLHGAWVADVVLATSAPVPPTSPIVIGDLTLLGSAVRVSSFAGSRSARVVGGYGGWRKRLGARAYDLPTGVMASMVVGDLAAEAGEVAVVASDYSLGTAYTREDNAPASRTLTMVAGESWYVDPTGTTYVRSIRPASLIMSPFTVIHWSGAQNHFQIASETLSDWMPGRTFTAPTVGSVYTVSMVRHQIDASGRARMEVLAHA